MRYSRSLAVLASIAACAGPAPEAQPEPGTCIVACGQRIPIGTRVVLWDEPGGYSAYSDQLHFEAPAAGTEVPQPGSLRFEAGRRTKGAQPQQLVEPGSEDLEALRPAVDLFVLHYDACGYAERCFRVLHDRRGLSVHFLLDVDGTIYQTLDLRERAWHAGEVNTRSIGVEIANIGSRRTDDGLGLEDIDAWYSADGQGLRLDPPHWAVPKAVHTPGFVGYSARDERVEGLAQGEWRAQYDFTPEQYEALVLLAAALVETFPRIDPDAPRGPDGEVLTSVMAPGQLASFGGIVGHHHVSAVKQDPGPAFRWEPFLEDVGKALARGR